jgi:hypothetical protein
MLVKDSFKAIISMDLHFICNFTAVLWLQQQRVDAVLAANVIQHQM